MSASIVSSEDDEMVEEEEEGEEGEIFHTQQLSTGYSDGVRGLKKRFCSLSD
jgi:hypothetical protein